MKNVITKPLITEKSLALAGRGWYTFAASLNATKAEIARSIETHYSVTVTNVRTMVVPGKVKRTGKSRFPVRKSNWKKASAHLAKGQTISAFEVTQQEAARPPARQEKK